MFRLQIVTECNANFQKIQKLEVIIRGIGMNIISISSLDCMQGVNASVLKHFYLYFVLSQYACFIKRNTLSIVLLNILKLISIGLIRENLRFFFCLVYESTSNFLLFFLY